MTNKQHIQNFLKQYKKLQELTDTFNSMFGFDESSQVYETLDSTTTLLLNQTELLIGDTEQWLSWYVFENDCGKKGYEAGYDDDLKPIQTIDDLLDLIETATLRTLDSESFNT